MAKNKILVLGTGNAQSDFIDFCRNSGLEVFSCSNRIGERGSQFADHFELIDITNIDKVQKYVEINKIDLVYSTGSDIAMPTVAVVSKELGLNSFISPQTAIICNDKFLLRNMLKCIPNFSVASSLLEQEADSKNWVIFPAIIKPVDSQGQRGISIIDNVSQIVPAFKKALVHSRSQKAIIEEYINGFEISVNIYVIQGSIKFIFITDRISFEEFPGGIIKKHIYPARKSVKFDQILQLITSVIKLINLENGPGYFQVMVDQYGNPKVIEVTPRLDGCHIWRLIKEVKGINLFEVVLNHLLDPKYSGREFAQNFHDQSKIAELSFFTSPPNVSFQTNNYHVSEAIYTEWYYEDGELVRPINNYAEKTGYQIIFG